ncbi:MAG TPA: IS1595 family transposase, partial [Pedobacter sp.]
MQQLNRYYRRSRISEKKFREIIKCFALDLTANRTAVLTG